MVPVYHYHRDRRCPPQAGKYDKLYENLIKKYGPLGEPIAQGPPAMRGFGAAKGAKKEVKVVFAAHPSKGVQAAQLLPELLADETQRAKMASQIIYGFVGGTTGAG